jgi:cytochrome P450
MHVLTFDPFGAEFTHDPYPFLERARRKEPVFFAPEIGMWVVTRWEDVRRVLSETQSFISDVALDPLKPFTDETRAVLSGSGPRATRGLSDSDGADHRRMRRVAAKALTPRRLKVLEPQIAEIVDEHIDRFKDRGHAEILRELADPVPLHTMFVLLGVPLSELETVMDGTEDRMELMWELPSDERQPRLAAGVGNFYGYTRELIRQRIADDLRDDFPSDLIRAANADGEAILSMDEIATLVYGVMFGGHMTTTALIVNCVRMFGGDPERWRGLVEDPSRIPAAVEEVLRVDPSVLTLRRSAVHDVELGGVEVAQGDKLLLVTASANRDDARFECPAEFRPGRTNVVEHLTFGKGAHFCLGAPLARIEMRIVFERLVDAFPALRLRPGRPHEYRPNIGFRLMRELEVEW